MAARVLESQLVARFIDRISGPARGASRSLDRLQASAGSKRFLGGMNAMAATTTRLEGALAGFAARVALPLATGFGAVQLDKIARSTETALTRLGITAGVSAEKLAAAKREIQAVAPDLGVAQGELYRVLETMVAGGMGWGEAVKALPAVVRAAKASGTEVEDVARSAIAVMGNLKVPVAEIERAFDAMVAGGKLGSFELKDMAREFPGLAASAAKLGMAGTDAVADLAAMAQVARKTAGSSSEAANNMLNFLEKLTANETVKNFKKFGLNIEAVFKRSKKTGQSFFDAMMDEIERITKGDPFRVAQLFPDAQARNFLMAMTANRQEYARFRQEARSSAGAVAADFRRISATTDEAYARAGAALENLAEKFGSTMAPATKNFADGITRAAGELTAMLDEAERRYTVLDRLRDAITPPGEAGKPIQIGGDVGRAIDDFGRKVDALEDKLIGGAKKRITDYLFGREATVDPSGKTADAALARTEEMAAKLDEARGQLGPAEAAVAAARGKTAKRKAQAAVDEIRAEVARLKTAVADARAFAGRMKARDMTGVEAGEDRAADAVDGRRSAGMTAWERGSEVPALEAEVARLRERLDTMPRPRIEGAIDPLSGQRTVTEGALAELEARLKTARAEAQRQAGSIRPPTPFAPPSAAAPRSDFALPTPRGMPPGTGKADGFALPLPRPSIDEALAPYRQIPERLAAIGGEAGRNLDRGITGGLASSEAAAENANARIAGAFDALGGQLHASGLAAALQLAAGIRAGIPEIAGAAGAAAAMIAARTGAPRSQAVAAPPAVDGARAEGGPVWSGGSFLVGEEGPEIFKPDRPGAIVPNDDIGTAAPPRPRSPAAPPKVSVSLSPSFHISGAQDPQAVAAAVDEKLRAMTREANEMLRGLFADYGPEVG